MAARAVDGGSQTLGGFVSSRAAAGQLRSCMVVPSGQQQHDADMFRQRAAGAPSAHSFALPSFRLLSAASSCSTPLTASYSSGSSAVSSVAEACAWQQYPPMGWSGGWGCAAATKAAGYESSGLWGGAGGAMAAASDGREGQLDSVLGGCVSGGWVVGASPIAKHRQEDGPARDNEVPKSSMMKLFQMPTLL